MAPHGLVPFLLQKREELRSKIKYEDLVNIFKNAKIKTIIRLEEVKFT